MKLQKVSANNRVLICKKCRFEEYGDIMAIMNLLERYAKGLHLLNPKASPPLS